MHTVGRIDGELERDDPTVGVPSYVRPVDLQALEQSNGVSRLSGDAERSLTTRAPHPTASVVMNQPVVPSELGLVEQRMRQAPDDHAQGDEQDRVAVPPNLILDLRAVELNTLHGLSGATLAEQTGPSQPHVPKRTASPFRGERLDDRCAARSRDCYRSQAIAAALHVPIQTVEMERRRSRLPIARARSA